MSCTPKGSPHSLVAPGARLGERVTIGLGAVIEEGAVIGDDTIVMAHVVVYSGVHVGRQCILYPGAVLGEPGKGPSRGPVLVIGDRNAFREHVVLLPGTSEAPTRIGSDNLFMSCCLVGRGCVVGDGNVVGNFSSLGDRSSLVGLCIVGGLANLSSGVRVGRMAMVGGMANALGDVPPFLRVSGNPCASFGLNVIALRRRGVSAEVRASLKRAHRAVFLPEGGPEAILRDPASACESDETREFLEFARRSKRLIGLPAQPDEEDGDADHV